MVTLVWGEAPPPHPPLGLLRMLQTPRYWVGHTVCTHPHSAQRLRFVWRMCVGLLWPRVRTQPVAEWGIGVGHGSGCGCTCGLAPLALTCDDSGGTEGCGWGGGCGFAADSVPWATVGGPGEEAGGGRGRAGGNGAGGGGGGRNPRPPTGSVLEAEGKKRGGEACACCTWQ